MNLPKEKRNNFYSTLASYLANNQSGQILVIFLLILVVGLAITLSIASRTVIDIRQTSTSDESNKAYFAAESGIQSALKKISLGQYIAGSPYTFSVAFSNVDNSQCAAGSNCSTSTATIKDLAPPTGGAFQFPDNIARDDVGQVNLMCDFSTLGSAGTTCASGVASIFRNDGLRIYFSNATDANLYAIEVSVVSYCASGCLPLGQWAISKYAFDANTTRGNNFCSVTGTGSFTPAVELPTQTSFKFYVDIPNLSSVIAGCTSDTIPSSSYNPVLARIRPLYNNNTAIPIAVVGCQSGGTCSANPKSLPIQGQVVTSVGTTPSGVTRKLLVYRSYPALPALFDYVLFNGSSSIPLQK